MENQEFNPSTCEDPKELNRIGYEFLAAKDLKRALRAFSRANELAPSIAAAANAIYARTQISDQLLNRVD